MSDADDLKRVLVNDPFLGQVMAGEVLTFRGGEYLATMVSRPMAEEVRLEIENAVNRILRLLQSENYRGQTLRFTFRTLTPTGQSTLIVVAASPMGQEVPVEPGPGIVESPPAEPEPTPPAITLPPPPTFATIRIAEAGHENAKLFWSKHNNETRGLIHILYTAGDRKGQWEEIEDHAPAGTRGFEWIATLRDLGELLVDEHHGDGGRQRDHGCLWIKAIDQTIYACPDSGQWVRL